MSLAGNINQLIRTHVAYSHNGKIVKQKPLLEQLTDFIGSNGISSSNETPIPGSIKALSLHVQLERDAQNHQYRMTGSDKGGLWEILASWTTINDDEWQPYLKDETQNWIEEIHAVMDPPRARRPLRQPCAACDQRWIYDADGKRSEAVTAWVWTSDGEQVDTLENWDVQCSLCGAQWHGKEVAKSYWRAPR